MKKLFLAFICFVCAAIPAFSSDKAKAGAGVESAKMWIAKAKNFEGKEVSTYVANVQDFGYAKEDAPFAVVIIETANAKKQDGGEIHVIMPYAKLKTFGSEYMPKIEKGQSPFGGKADLKTIHGVFTVHAGEPALLYGISPDKIKTAPKASVVLAEQIANDPSKAGASESSKPGYTKKIFNVSKIGKDKTMTKSEFSRLVGLYNKGKKKPDQVKAEAMKDLLEEGSDPFTAFDDAKKIEWEIRK